MTIKDFKETTIESKISYEGKIINVSVDKVRMPDGKEAIREVVHHNGGVTIVALPDESSIVLVKQYRYPIGKATWELPAGRLNLNEDPVLGAKRELKEETGFIPKQMDSLGIVYPAPGYSNEVLYFFKATDLIDDEAEPDPDENLEVKVFSIKEAWQMIKDGEMRDAKSMAGLSLVIN